MASLSVPNWLLYLVRPHWGTYFNVFLWHRKLQHKCFPSRWGIYCNLRTASIRRTLLVSVPVGVRIVTRILMAGIKQKNVSVPVGARIATHIFQIRLSQGVKIAFVRIHKFERYSYVFSYTFIQFNQKIQGVRMSRQFYVCLTFALE